MVLGHYYLWVDNPILSINPPSELSSERACVFRKWLKMVIIPILRFKYKNEPL
jgi:hypothetical protein